MDISAKKIYVTEILNFVYNGNTILLYLITYINRHKQC